MTELLLKNKTLLMLCKKLCPVTHVLHIQRTLKKLFRIRLYANRALGHATQNVLISISGKGKVIANPTLTSLCQARYKFLPSTMVFI